jgi:uncharacterized protein YhjY with autotransporter beta-barrel domain
LDRLPSHYKKHRRKLYGHVEKLREYIGQGKAMHYFYMNPAGNGSRAISDADTFIGRFIRHRDRWFGSNFLIHTLQLVLLLGLGLVLSSEAKAASAGNGNTLFHSVTYGCNSCHDDPPSTPQLNAANSSNSTVLNYIISNNFGAWMGTYKAAAIDGVDGSTPLSASDRADIAAYLESIATPISVSAPFHGSNTSIPLKLTHDAAPIAVYSAISLNGGANGASASTTYGTVSVGTDIGGFSTASGGTTPTNEYAASYTHSNSATDCTADSFTAVASGVGGTSSTRTVNVTITPPTINISSSPTTANAFYSTNTAITVSHSGIAPTSLTTVSAPNHGGTLDLTDPTSIVYKSNPSAYFASETFTYRANGPCSTTSSNVTVTVTVSAPPTPVITNGTLTASGSTDVAFGGYTITASNLPTSFNATNLPPGLSINTSTGAITGTPTTAGSYSTTISATNSSGTGSATLAFTIALSAPTVTSAGTANGATGVAFNYAITASSAPTSYNATGLPAGLSVNTSTGVISGTPTANGTTAATISATNATGTGTKSLTINISLTAPSITSSLTASGATGVAFSGYTITATNSPTSFNASGLPPGLSVNTSTGAISGTPTTNGTYNVSISATNATATDTQTLVFTIALSAPSITSSLTASGATGVAFGGYTITATNSPTSFNATGLPAGLTVNTSTGVISGTPTTNGSYNVSISATNATATDSKTLVITIALSAPAITSSLTASGATGVAFGGYTITASNFPSSFGASSLPPGLNINTSTGVISGTPTLNGTFNTTITATNATASDSKTLVFTIALSAPAITSAATASGTTGSAFSYQITASNLPTSYAASGLPAGVSVNAGTGLISGTPTAGGTFSASVSATNATATASQAVTITIGFSPPTAGAASMTVPVNTSGTLDLTPYITGFTGFTVSGVSVATQPTHGVATVSGTNVTYTPSTNYFGTDTFAYVASGSGGTSTTPGVVTVTISGRPDPSRDATVTGVVNAQIDTARRFTRAQISNFTGRLEALHHSKIRSVEVASLTRDTASDSSPPVPVDTRANTSSNAVQTSQPQPSFNRPVSTGASKPADNADQPLSISSDPMGADAPIAGSAPKSSDPIIVRKKPASGATAIRNSSLSAQQGAANPGTANHLMGDGVRFGVRDLANQTAQMQNPFVVLTAALSAAAGSSQSAPVAELGKALTTAVSTIQNSSFNLNSSTGTAADGSTLPGGFNYWISGGVRFGTRDQTSTSNSLDFTTDGISIGADKRLNDLLAVGMGVGFGRDKTTIGTDGTNSTAHSSTIAVYGSFQPTDGIFIDGVVGYGALGYKTERYVSAANAVAQADRSGDHYFTSLTAGYDYRSDGLHLSPYGRLDAAVDRLHQSTETGAGAFDLSYARQSTQSTSLSLGLRAETAHEMDFGSAMPRMRIEFKHDFKGEQQASVAYADLPTTSYAITSTTTNLNSLLFGLGSDFLLHNGLRLSLDYQMERTSMHDNSQAVLFKLTKELDGKGYSSLLIPSTGFSLRDWKVRGDAGYTFDSNINRSSTTAERLTDSSYNAELTKSWLLPAGGNTRFVIGTALGGEKFHTYTGLDRMYLSSQVEYQYRASGEFGTPIWGIFGSATAEAYASTLRDGYRYSGGVSVRKPITDRINLFSALAHNERNGYSAVFKTRDNSFKLNFDYALTEDSTIYLNTEYRRGDLVSSGSHSLQNIDIAKVFTLDDVFTRNDFYDYRFDGTTALFTLGYNIPFGPKDSIDFSWQRVRSTATKGPTVPTWHAQHYFDNQFSVVYLFSF